MTARGGAAGSLALATLLAGCSSGGAGAKPESKPTPPSVRVVTARTATLHPALTIPGTIAPSQTVALSNALSEPTLEVDVEEGDRVRRGQLLAQLDVDDLQASLQAAKRTAGADAARTAQMTYTERLTLAQAPTQVTQTSASERQARETLAEARRNLARDRSLAAQGYIPQQNVDEQEVVVRNDALAIASTRAQVRSAVANERENGTPDSGLQASTVEEARQQAAAAEATAEQLARQIARARIVSPVDGVVVNRNLNPGEYPAGRQIFTIEADDTVDAILTASSTQVYAIAVGDPVRLQAAGLRDATHTGKVVAVLDAATPGSTNFTIKVAVPNGDHALRAGTPVRAAVALRPLHGVVVPSSAFVTDARTSVIAVRDGVARIVRVTEVGTDGASSVVSGLAAGSRIASDGGAGVTDGEHVAIAGDA